MRVAELRGSGEQEITLQGMKRLVGNGDKETMHLLMCADSRTDIPPSLKRQPLLQNELPFTLFQRRQPQPQTLPRLTPYYAQ